MAESIDSVLTEELGQPIAAEPAGHDRGGVDLEGLLVDALRRHIVPSSISNTTSRVDFEVDTSIDTGPLFTAWTDFGEGKKWMLHSHNDGPIRQGVTFSISPDSDGIMLQIGREAILSPKHARQIGLDKRHETSEALGVEDTIVRRDDEGNYITRLYGNFLLLTGEEAGPWHPRGTLIDLAALLAYGDAGKDSAEAEALLDVLRETIELFRSRYRGAEPCKHYGGSGFGAPSDLSAEQMEGILTISKDLARPVVEAFIDIVEHEEEPPELEALRPTTYYNPIAKTTQALTDPQLFDSGGVVLDVGRKSGQLRINFALSNTGEEPRAEISMTAPIDREDVRVIAAVSTLKNRGNTTISPRQIAETMGCIRPNAEVQKAIHGRVMKLRNIDGRIDWTAQARKYSIPNPDTGRPFERAVITGHLLDCTVFDGVDDMGNRYIRYKLGEDPITYQHAHLIEQVQSWPVRLNSLPPITEDGNKRKRVTQEQGNIRDAILTWVYAVKGKRNKMGNSIYYDTLFRHAGLVNMSSGQRRRAVAFVNDYLRALQGDGVIKGFSMTTAGRSHKPESVAISVSRR